MSILDLIGMCNICLLIADFKDSSSITIGVPHHTTGGTPHMQCSEHPDGDENTGYIGKYIADQLACSFVCACNYFIDPNKTANTDYSVAIAKSNPKYLVEIHGHGKKSSLNDVEISCGSKEKEDETIKLKIELEKLIKTVAKKDTKWEILKTIKIEAEFDKIHFKATESATVRDKRWKSFHIELSPTIRIDDTTKKVPEIGSKFGEILFQAIKKVCDV